MNFNYPKGIIDTNTTQSVNDTISHIIKQKSIVNPIIKDDIFTILEAFCKVIYYPIEDSVSSFFIKFNENEFNDSVVFINTNTSYEKQVFAAAYELAYVTGVIKDNQNILSVNDLFSSQHYVSSDSNHSRLTAIYFASQLLVPDNILEKYLIDMKMKDTDCITVEGILKLMDLFLFPYEPMIMKLYINGNLSKTEYEHFLSLNSISDNSIFQFQKRFGLCSKNNNLIRTKKFSNFIDLAIKSYKITVRTYDKLECLLKLFDLTPELVGVKKKINQYTTEKELELQRVFDDYDEKI